MGNSTEQTNAVVELPTVHEIEQTKIFCNAIVEQHAPTTGSIIESPAAGIWLVDRNMKVVWMNDQMEKIYGSFNEHRGRHCYQQFRGRSSKCVDCLPTQAFETGNIISGHVARTTNDGVKRHYQLIEAPLFDEQNEVFRVMEIVLDITEQKRLQETVRQSESEYRALFERSGTAVAATNTQNRFVRVNRQFEELSGYSKNELLAGVDYMQFIHPRDRSRVHDYSRQRKSDPNMVPNSYEFAFVSRWGEEKQAFVTVNDLPNGDQIASIIDLTEKYNLEREIRSKEQFLANILRHSVEAIIAMDTDGIVRSWNRGAELISGYRARDIVGHKFSTVLLPKFRRSKKYREIKEKYEEQGFIRNVRLQSRTKDGRHILLEMTRTSIYDKDGKEIGSSAILRDITEKQKLEQRMIQQERMLALGEMAASLAHEIKNPLNSMVINMEVMKAHLSDLEVGKRHAIEKYTKVLMSEIGRLNKVMTGVLSFARPLTGTFEKVDVGAILSDVVELVKPQAKQENVKIQLKVEPELPSVDAAEDHLKQVFLNLFLNSFQAVSKSGSIQASVTQMPDKSVDITIKDNGCGIPRRNLKRIFDLYFSTKDKGSGLGLPMVKRIVNAHNGNIHVTSKVNYGTTFHINLPASG